MNDAKSNNAGRRVASGYYNPSSHRVKNCGQWEPVHFRDFLGSVEGSIWWVGRPRMPAFVSPEPECLPDEAFYLFTSAGNRMVAARIGELLAKTWDLQRKP